MEVVKLLHSVSQPGSEVCTSENLITHPAGNPWLCCYLAWKVPRLLRINSTKKGVAGIPE